MSPEQVRGKELDSRTDLFSCGAVLYEMCTGTLPFRGDTSGVIFDSILNRTPVPLLGLNPDAPPRLEEIINKALEKDRDLRCQSAAELRADLKRLTRDTESGKIVPSSTAIRRSRRKVAITLAAFALVAAALIVGGWFYLARGRDRIDSVAVLPFVNTSGDPNAEYLSDGITEGVINSLSQLPQLRVIARTTVFRYKTPDVDPQRVGHDLGVRAVVVGTLVKRGDILSVETELVDVSNGTEMWGTKYNRHLSDAYAVEEQIVGDISEKLRLRLSGDEKKRVTKLATQNRDAYQLYLKGRYYWNKRTEDGFNKAKDYFNDAIGIDPNYASAYAGLADDYLLLGVDGFISTTLSQKHIRHWPMSRQCTIGTGLVQRGSLNEP